MTTEIILVRHATSSHQAPEAPLTAAGIAQAQALAELLDTLDIARIVSSPLRRAVQTAEPFSARSGLSIELDPRLSERRLSGSDLPDWRAHLRASFIDLDRCLEGGESARDARMRGLAVIDEAVATGRRTVLVTHGTLLALLLGAFDPSIGYEVWDRLSIPDVYIVQTRAGTLRRIWNG